MIDLIYYMFYCSAGNDGTKSKHEMVAFGMELVATQLLSFFTFIISGILNFRISTVILWFLIIFTNGIIAYYFINRYYIKSGRYNKILVKYSTATAKKNAFYKRIVILIFIASFVLLFCGGILMSFLFSLHK